MSAFGAQDTSKMQGRNRRVGFGVRAGWMLSVMLGAASLVGGEGALAAPPATATGTTTGAAGAASTSRAAGSTGATSTGTTVNGKASGAGSTGTGSTGAGSTGAGAAVATPTDPVLEAAISKVQASYAKFESYRADFTQAIHTSGLARPRVDTGVVELKKGGKMHWEFKTPDVRHFISDGKTLWVYSPADKQALASPLTQETNGTAMNFMSGLGDIRRDFKVSLPTEPENQKKGMIALQLVPKESIGTLKYLVILASESDGLVKQAVVQDQLGSKTVLEFNNAQLNSKLDEARFTFSAPKGVNVIQTAGY